MSPAGQSLGAGGSRKLRFICLRAKGNRERNVLSFTANELTMHRGPGWELQGGIKGGGVGAGGKGTQECILKAQNQSKGMETSAISSPRLGSYSPNWVFTLPGYIGLGSLGHLKRPQHRITRGPTSSFAH